MLKWKQLNLFITKKMTFGWAGSKGIPSSQGKTLEELKENLKDIYQDLSGGKIPHVRTPKFLNLFRDTVKSLTAWQSI